MVMLSKLSSLVKKRKRIGRGGSRGGTSTKGHKGQKARSGGEHRVRTTFEGGQMPLTRRLPKRGFSNKVFKKNFEIINLGRLNEVFEADSTINKELLIDNGLIKGFKGYLVKVLGNGELTKKFVIYADAFSDVAKEAILNKGGKVHITKEK